MSDDNDTPKKTTDVQVYRPDYYAVDPCPHCGHPLDIGDVIGSFGYWRAASMKYVVRAGRKSPETEVIDLEKGSESILREVARVEARTRWGHDLHTA